MTAQHTSPIAPASAPTPDASVKPRRPKKVRTGGPSGPSDLPRSLRPSTAARVITWVVLAVALLYFVFPIYWVIVSATKSNPELANSSGLWFATGDVGSILDSVRANYDALMSFTSGRFWRWVGNSILYSTVAGAAGTLVSVMAGYGLAKYRFRGSGAFQLMVMAGLLLPVALLTIPLYIVMHSLNLTDTMWAIIIPSCVSPFGVFLGRMYAGISVPDELIEAARIDGSGEFRIFLTIVLRLLAPAMVTIFLFIFVATWNNFLLPLMMVTNVEELKPVTLGLHGMMSYFDPTYGAVLQGALLGVLPLMFLFLVLQRYWQSGLAVGAVKG